MPATATTSHDELPTRFRVTQRTLWFDRLMTALIKVGGVLVITAVAGIFLFILAQILPLFRGAEVAEVKSVPAGPAALLAVDEWAELPALIGADGTLTFIDVAHGAAPKHVVPQYAEPRAITAVAYRQSGQRVIVGTGDGRFALVPLNYAIADGRVMAEPKPEPFFEIGPDGSRVVQIAFGDSGDDKLAAAICEVNGRREVHAATLTQKRSLLGKSKVAVGERFDLSADIAGAPERVLVTSNADGVLVATASGEIDYFFRTGGKLALRQRFTPFAGSRIATMDFLLGDVSVCFTDGAGENVIYSLFVPAGGGERVWGKTKTLPALGATPDAYAASLRNKSFLIAADSIVSLRHSTTESIRWQSRVSFNTTRAIIGGKHDRFLLLDTTGTLHVFTLSDAHPEASWHALFGRLWYEGANAPKFEWQSTGGTDDFEPKLSLVPLLAGTLKGTFYALLFALPVALLAALYTAQFLEPRFKRSVKPAMEIMASLPSVVLGFIAALWLAPTIETRVPSIIAVVVLVPASALLVGWLWAGLPYERRRRIRPGYEVFVFMPILLAAAWIGWQAGPVLERVCFGGDFRQWWPQVTGADFQQRNSLVIGFIMGFAIIPIIFTIAEDALSNVPTALTSASLALGASRWQTAIYVVLPTASAGIFSAVMIGLGRAIGETMIVVMATGNTPIMDMNIFSGMRTLSANIAVELPEAPHHGTLYRTLFLGAMLLFLMTFAINTIAEILRQRLRERYKTV